jgi:phosphoglycerol transferase MdoB-like AlkP superfamily enzyme
MGWRDLSDNMKAAWIAGVAGVLMLISGATGASQWERTFETVANLVGPSPVLRFLALVFIAIGSVGGVFVLLGAYGFRNDRVRTARTVIWFGTGFTILSLIAFVVYQWQRGGDFPFAGASFLGFLGILLSVVARFKAKPLPRSR